jgi:phosphopantothenoylcysteine decarboxylase / phosphopantothenate---cysteine ligase
MGKPDPAKPLKDIRSSVGDELEGRKVILCVTGSVASIEVPALARGLMRHGAEVNVVMSEAAEKLVRPETLQWATGNPVVRKLTGETEHVRLAGDWEGKAHLVLIAPCTANTISKIALGIDDTPVTTMASMALGGGIPLVVCPAAHEPMYRNPAVRANVLSLEERGVEFVGPRYEEEKAKMATVDEIVDAVVRRLSAQDFRGRKVLVSGGPTIEFIDPVRVITNLSSGKMGLALAKEAWRRGAEVFYVFGGNLHPPAQIGSKRVRTTAEMMKAVLEELGKARYDIFISAAAPSDFTPVSSARKKLRTDRGRVTLGLMPTPKIIDEVRRRMPKIYLVAFKAETSGSAKELRSAISRFKDKVGANMVVANDVSGGKSFGTDTNSVLILTRRRTSTSGELPKDKIARILLDEVIADQRT